MSIFDFCGTWVERHDGDSLEPLMRAMKVRESKIQESVNATPTQKIWVKNTTLVTAYTSQFGEVVSSFAVNGGWRMSTKKPHSKQQIISRCSYDATRKLLAIEKKLSKQGGILRDERRVERTLENKILIKQRLEFIPLSKSSEENGPESSNTIQQSVVAHRTWERVSGNPIDDLLDRFRGVWIIVEEASESLRPIFEAMQLPAGSIRSALALRTQHSIFLSGPRELLFVNQSLHGDIKSATPPVKEIANGEQISFPERGKMACYATSQSCITLLSTSEDGYSSNRDERTLADDGLYFTQRIFFKPLGGEDVIVNRRWKRAPLQPSLWFKTIPFCRSESRIAAVNGDGAQRSVLPSVSVPQKVTETKSVTSTLVRNGTLTNALKVETPQVSVSTTQTTTSSSTVSGWFAFAFGPFPTLALMLLSGTVARYFVEDTMVSVALAPVYMTVRKSRASSGTKPTSQLPSSSWAQTVGLFMISTIALFYPSKGRGAFHDDVGDTAFLLLALASWGLSRFYSFSRSTRMKSVVDQWVAISGASMIVTAVLYYGLPKIILGDDDNDPGITPITVFILLAAVWLRVYAWTGPPPSLVPENEIASKQQHPFTVGVKEYRISESGNYGEYLVYVRLSNGKEYSSWQRYSAFRTFRKDLGREDIELPSKRLFGSYASEVMSDRMASMDAFIKRIFQENGDETFLNSSHEARLFVGAPPMQ